MLSISVKKKHFINLDISEHNTLRVNPPTTSMAEVTDSTPVEMEYPLNMECRVAETLEFPMQSVYIG